MIIMETAVDCPDNGGAAGVGYGFEYPVFWIDRYHSHSVRQHTRSLFGVKIDC